MKSERRGDPLPRKLPSYHTDSMWKVRSSGVFVDPGQRKKGSKLFCLGIPLLSSTRHIRSKDTLLRLCFVSTGLLVIVDMYGIWSRTVWCKLRETQRKTDKIHERLTKRRSDGESMPWSVIELSITWCTRTILLYYADRHSQKDQNCTSMRVSVPLTLEEHQKECKRRWLVIFLARWFHSVQSHNSACI